MRTWSASRNAGLAWLVGASAYLMAEAVAAAAFRPSYAYSRDFVSDLGVPVHSPLAWLMNTAFGVQGLLFLVGAVSVAHTRLLVAFAAVNTVGNVAIAILHSGTGGHAAGAVLAIVGGNSAVLAGASIHRGWRRRVSIGLGIFGLLGFALFVIDLGWRTWPLGAVERCSVYPITAWQILTATTLLRRQPTSWRRPARRDGTS